MSSLRAVHCISASELRRDHFRFMRSCRQATAAVSQVSVRRVSRVTSRAEASSSPRPSTWQASGINLNMFCFPCLTPRSRERTRFEEYRHGPGRVACRSGEYVDQEERRQELLVELGLGFGA